MMPPRTHALWISRLVVQACIVALLHSAGNQIAINREVCLEFVDRKNRDRGAVTSLTPVVDAARARISTRSQLRLPRPTTPIVVQRERGFVGWNSASRSPTSHLWPPKPHAKP